MSVRVNLNDVSSGYNLARINSNFERISEALGDAVSRSGETPNSMSADLDLNSNDILNGGVGNFASVIVDGVDVTTLAGADGADGADGTNGTNGVGVPAGGTAGQVLAKVDGTDYNTEWVAQTGGGGGGSGDLVAANNLSDVANAATARANLGLAIGTNVQAYDADLTTWASLTPSANAQSLVTAANYAAMRTLLDLEAGTDFYSIAAANAAFQPLDSDLTTWAGLTPSANAQSLVTAANYAAMRALLDLEAGTDFYSIAAADAAFQPKDADLTTWAGLTPSANAQSLVTAVDYSAMRTLLSLVPGTNVQAYDAQLADIAGVTFAQGDILYFNGTNLVALSPGTNGQFLKTQGAAANPTWATIAGGGDLLAANNLSDLANAATARTNLGLAIGTNVQAYDADLTTWAGLTPSANAQSLVTAADYAAMRTLLGLVIGTNVQAYDADLTTWAGITPGTGVGAALAVNVGTAGAFVVNGGALGTPSSGVGTNLTGTATGLTAGISNALKSATTTVDVSAAAAPTSGQVLTATAGTTATWQTPTSFTAATQAEQEAASSTTVGVTPGRQQYHPSAAKAWFKSTGTTSQTLQVNYNITSLSDDGTGLVGVTIATDFSTLNYAVSGAVQTSWTASGGFVFAVNGLSTDKPAAGTFEIVLLANNSAKGDIDNGGGGSPVVGVHCIMFGDQA